MITASRECGPYSARVVYRHPDCRHDLATVSVQLRLDGLYGVEVNHGTSGASDAAFARIRALAILIATQEADEITEGLRKAGYTVVPNA